VKKTLLLLVLVVCTLDLHAQAIFIKAGKLITPDTGTAALHQDILIEGAKIKAVGRGLPVPPGATVIDLSDSAVMPGLFDCHTHMCLALKPQSAIGSFDYLRYMLHWTATETTAYRAIQGVANARAMLEAGFTTIRDVGNAANYADTDLRRAIEEGLVPGPTVINSGRIIAPYGGQFPRVLTPERRELAIPEYLYADTRDELRKAIRENIQYGAKVIKIVVDDQPYIYSAEDIRFIVDEAASAGLKVAAHCMTRRGIHNAVVAGVASIEHAWTITDEDLELARRNGVVLVGTDFPASFLEEMRWPAELHTEGVERLKRAHKIGVTLAFGSDAYLDLPGYTRGTQAIAFVDVFVEAGLPPQVILQALTNNAARLLGVDNDRGAIRPGLAADLIANPGNPLDNVQTLKQVTFVMKDGKIIRQSK